MIQICLGHPRPFSQARQHPDRLLPVFCPPLFSLDVRIVSKLHPTLFLVRPQIGIAAIGIRVRTRARSHTRARTRIPDRRRTLHSPPHILPHPTQRHLHRGSHLSISLLLLRSIREMKDDLVLPGRSLRVRGAGVADGFVGVQEGGDLGAGREAGEEVAEDGCVFNLACRWVDWTKGTWEV